MSSIPLRALKPKWLGFDWYAPQPLHIGVRFTCPHCGKVRVGVFFKNPIDPGNLAGRLREFSGFVDACDTWEQWMTKHPENKYWTRRGDTFADLDLTPSVDVSQHGHWHGMLTLGIAQGGVTAELLVAPTGEETSK